MNIIGESDKNNLIASILTFTVIKKPPEIFLMAFVDGYIKYCDIDDRALNKEIFNRDN